MVSRPSTGLRWPVAATSNRVCSSSGARVAPWLARIHLRPPAAVSGRLWGPLQRFPLVALR
eukprot:7190153-Pyramimonas_sp.AAC.1